MTARTRVGQRVNLDSKGFSKEFFTGKIQTKGFLQEFFTGEIQKKGFSKGERERERERERVVTVQRK